MGLDWPKSFKPWVSGDANWGPLGCYFNSALSKANVTPGSNATLTIYLRLQLIERNAKDVNQLRKTPPAPDLLRDWPPGQFRLFKEAVKSKSEGFWDKRFCLVNQADVSTLDVKLGSTTIRPNVDCRFEVVWAESTASAHQVINCFYPSPSKEISKHVNPSSDGVGVGQFSVDLVENSPNSLPDANKCLKVLGDPLKPGELKTEYVSCPMNFDHLGVAHEIGHLLGLPHVGIARRSHACLQAMQDNPEVGGNARVCYIGDNSKDASNIMGIGNQVAGWNAMPWLTRLFQHTGIGPHAWKVSPTIVPPTVL